VVGGGDVSWDEEEGEKCDTSHGSFLAKSKIKISAIATQAKAARAKDKDYYLSNCCYHLQLQFVIVSIVLSCGSIWLKRA